MKVLDGVFFFFFLMAFKGSTITLDYAIRTVAVTITSLLLLFCKKLLCASKVCMHNNSSETVRPSIHCFFLLVYKHSKVFFFSVEYRVSNFHYVETFWMALCMLVAVTTKVVKIEILRRIMRGKWVRKS